MMEYVQADKSTGRDPVRVELEWAGPLPGQESVPRDAGLYAVVGRPYGATCEALLYVGEAKGGLRSRWQYPLHREWLARTVEFLDGSLFYTIPRLWNGTPATHLIVELESILIYLHQLSQCYRGISADEKKTLRPRKFIPQHLVIRNTGSVPNMIAEIDTRERWFGIASAFATRDH